MLMREYAAFLNASVGGEHICVESLEKELAELPGAYAEPGGTVLLAFAREEPAGCVALKPLTLPGGTQHERACEMKRLWVRPEQQGTGLGRQLTEAVLDAARARGYTAMFLDTMPASMRAAYRLYCSVGFAPVERYNDNPVLLQADSLEIAWLRKEL
jgi:ribosomal protein S18 acetylase RimI-like enzyme